jgi:hypothetical protein
MAMGTERVVMKLLGTLNSNVDGCCHCQCLRGERVRRKAVDERSFHEGAGAGILFRGTQCMQACCAELCAHAR